MAIFKRFIMVSLLMATTCQAGSWYAKDPEGWLWYKKTPPKTVLKTKKEASSANEVKASPSYRDQMKKVRQNFDEVQAKAILNPTIENVRAFQQAQNTVLYQADLFQKMLMMASLMETQTNETPIMTTPAAREISQQQTDKQLDQDIRALTQHYGIFFLVKNDCPYCHQFAPVVRELLNEYPFELKAISKDGQPMEAFPEAVPDNGTIKQLNPEGIYPCLFLVNPQSREVIPLAKGMINSVQLKENFRVVIQFLKNKGQRR